MAVLWSSWVSWFCLFLSVLAHHSLLTADVKLARLWKKWLIVRKIRYNSLLGKWMNVWVIYSTDTKIHKCHPHDGTADGGSQKDSSTEEQEFLSQLFHALVFCPQSYNFTQMIRIVQISFISFSAHERQHSAEPIPGVFEWRGRDRAPSELLRPFQLEALRAAAHVQWSALPKDAGRSDFFFFLQTAKCCSICRLLISEKWEKKCWR